MVSAGTNRDGLALRPYHVRAVVRPDADAARIHILPLPYEAASSDASTARPARRDGDRYRAVR